MKDLHNEMQNRKIARLKGIRLALVLIGVILLAAIIAVYLMHIPQAALPDGQEMPSQSTNRPQETRPEEETAQTSQPEESVPETTQTTQPERDQLGAATQEDDSANESNDKDLDERQERDQDDTDKDTADDTQNNGASSGTHRASQNIDLKPMDKTNEATSPEQEPAAVPGEDVPRESTFPAKPVLLILCILLGVDIGAIIVVSVMISAQKKNAGLARKTDVPVSSQTVAPLPTTQENKDGIQVAALHNIGKRPYQEDSLGVGVLSDGVLAVVADGMGGLSGGDRVSQKIVHTMLEYAQKLQPVHMDGALEAMVNGVNQEVNQMLGPEGIYKSGSTLLSVLVRRNRFHWITVGDSRIYYYHNGKLTQLNQEHNVGQEMLMRAARGEITYEEARNTPKKGRVTSFIGMGKLKYVDRSHQSIELEAGDRILLMTDGVFNALSDQTILSVLNGCPDIQAAAKKLEALVLQFGNPRQDNFTAIILGI